MRACDNCLRIAEGRTVGDEKAGKLMVSPYPVGHDQGNQRDSYREKVDLCTICAGYLSSGSMCGLSDRHQCREKED